MSAAAASARLIAVVGPSGAGKDTLLDGALAARPDLARVRRVISRPEAAGGEDFEGVGAAEFETRRAAGAFAVHWRAHGLSYGIPAEPVRAALAAGRTVLFNGSRGALAEARDQFPGLEVILVTAPIPVLASRLAARGREPEAEIAARLARADLAAPEGARVVLNDAGVAEGVARFLAALEAAAAAA